MAQAFKIDADATGRMLSAMKAAGGDAAGIFIKHASPELAISAYNANPAGVSKMVRLFGPKFAGEATRILGAGAALPEIQTALADMRSGIGPSNTIAFLQEGNTNALEFYKSNPGASGFITSFGAKNAGSLVNTAAGLKMPAQAVGLIHRFRKIHRAPERRAVCRNHRPGGCAENNVLPCLFPSRRIHSQVRRP